jgi:hypothetical protein
MSANKFSNLVITLIAKTFISLASSLKTHMLKETDFNLYNWKPVVY